MATSVAAKGLRPQLSPAACSSANTFACTSAWQEMRHLQEGSISTWRIQDNNDHIHGVQPQVLKTVQACSQRPGELPNPLRCRSVELSSAWSLRQGLMVPEAPVAATRFMTGYDSQCVCRCCGSRQRASNHQVPNCCDGVLLVHRAVRVGRVPRGAESLQDGGQLLVGRGAPPVCFRGACSNCIQVTVYRLILPAPAWHETHCAVSHAGDAT